MTRDLTTGSPMRLIWSFALPTLFGMLFQQFYNMMDTMIVGQLLGASALASVGSTSSINFFVIGFCMGVCNGFAIPVAQRMGAGDYSQMRRCVANAGWLSALFAVVLTVFTGLFCRTILTVMRTPEDIFDGAYWYILIIFLGIPTTFLYNLLAAVIRALGDSKTPVYFLAISSVLNIALDLLLILYCHAGVAGAALATVISQCISAALVIRCLMKEPGAIRLDLHSLRFDKIKLRQILQVGLPAGVQGVLFSLSNVVIQASINGFGETVMAGNSAASNIENFIYVALNAFYQANVSFTSQNMGAGNYHRIWKILFRVEACVLVLGLALGGLTYLFGPQLLSLYSPSPAVIAAGLVRLKIVAVTYVLCGFMDSCVGTLRGIGYSVLPMIVTLVGACALRLVWISVLFQHPAYHTVEVIYWSYPVSWVVTASVHFLCIAITMRKLKHHLGLA